MNVKKFFISMLVTFLVILVIGGGLMTANFMFGTNLSSEITNFLDKSDTKKVNILLMGLDKDRTRADVIMVVSLDPEFNTVNILSIPRDTRVQYSEGKYDKLNHAMGYKNPEETTIRLVRQVTGMPIHYYCEVDFMGFRDVIDILGGVYFDVPINMHYEDPAQNLSIHVNKGYQKLDGKQAEGVVRYRATYANGDHDRIPVQQNFLKALFEQKLQPEYLTKAPALIKEIYEHVKTNFSVADATGYIKMLRKMSADSLQTHTLPGESKYIGNVSYFVYDTSATRQLILENFGYPEEEAKRWREEQAKISSASPAPEDE